MNQQMLAPSFFRRPEVTAVARDLLGKVLVTDIDGKKCAGMIVETEAYAAFDKACHAHEGKRTTRTEPMFGPGGTSYVYLCYGIHHLFNISTNEAHIGEAVLIRALEPLDGIEHMLERRGMPVAVPRLTAGPGALSQAMGIDRRHTALPVFGPELWIEDRGIMVPQQDVVIGTRVGVAYAGEDAYRPYRFWIRGNAWVSKGKGL